MTQLAMDSPALLEGLTEAALILDDGHVAAANAAARDLLGDGIRGAALHQVINHPGVLAALEQGTEAAEGVELTGLGGSRRHWLMHSAALADGTSLIRFLDRSEARAAEQMRVDFVANASHELRTPLSTLIGYTETLREQADGIDSVRQLETSLRRHWESIPVKSHQYLLRFCDGPVLVTDELRSLRLDVVVSDERSAAHFVESFRSEIESRVVGRPVDVRWSRPAVAPQPLR